MSKMRDDLSHDKMMAIHGQIVSALESAGMDPCPAIKVAYEAMEQAWEVWNSLAKEQSMMQKILTEGEVKNES